MQKKYSGLIDQICLVASHKLEKSGLVRKKCPKLIQQNYTVGCL